MIRRLAAVFAALGLVLLVAAPAFATTEPLHQGTNIAWNDPANTVDCSDTDIPAPGPGQVNWIFVAHTSTNDFTMDAAFADGTIVTDKLPYKTPDTYEPHWFVTTSLTTLLTASITGSGTVGSGGFNLSHVCPNPGEQVPEAPMSSLLMVSAGLIGLGFLGWRMRRSRVAN